MSNLQNEDEQLDELLQEIDELSDCYEAEFEERPFIEFIDSAEDDQNEDGFALVFAFLFAILGAVFVGTGLITLLFSYSSLPTIGEAITESTLWNPLIGAFVGAVIGSLIGLIFDVIAFVTRTKDIIQSKTSTTVQEIP